MKQIIRNQSTTYIVVMAVLAIALSFTCLPEKVSSETNTYVMGRTRIAYTVPITPTPSCVYEERVGRFNFSKAC